MFLYHILRKTRLSTKKVLVHTMWKLKRLNPSFPYSETRNDGFHLQWPPASHETTSSIIVLSYRPEGGIHCNFINPLDRTIHQLTTTYSTHLSCPIDPDFWMQILSIVIDMSVSCWVLRSCVSFYPELEISAHKWIGDHNQISNMWLSHVHCKG